MPTLKKRLLKKQFAVILFVRLTAIQSLNLNYEEKKKERKKRNDVDIFNVKVIESVMTR